MKAAPLRSFSTDSLISNPAASGHLWPHLLSRLQEESVAVLDCSGSEYSDPVARSGADLLALCDWITPRLALDPKPPLVLLCLSNCHTFLSAFWACLRLGIPALPLALPRTATEQEREARRIAASYTNALLLHDEGGADFAGATARHGAPTLKPLSFSALCSAPAIEATRLADISVDPSAPAYLLETSGTTGSPRAACFNGQSEAAAVLERAVLWLFPLSSSSGISGAFAQHRLTAFLPLQEAVRNPDRMLALIEEHQITGLALPPVLLSALLRHLQEPSGPLQRRDLSSLTRVNIGSAPTSPSDLETLQTLLTPWGLAPEALHTGYGLTETGVVAWGPFNAQHAKNLPPGEALIGPLYKGVETRLVDGVLEVRKPFSFLGYLQTPCVDASGALALETFHSGQDWFHTGDHARLLEGEPDSPPQLVLGGRAKDILVVNSRKLSLPAIEQSLQQRFVHLLELACGCALSPEVGGANERLLLALAPTQELPDDLRQQLEQQIQAHLLEQFGVGAAAIELLEASAFPRTSTGKIRKAELVALLSGGNAAPAGQAAPHPPVQPQTERLHPVSTLEQQLLAWIRRHAPLHQPLHRQQKLSAFGIDSLAFAGLIGELERSHGRRCQLERCPNDPSIAEVVALFHDASAAQPTTADLGPPWLADTRNPAQVLVRHSHEQLLRAANLQSSGEPVGLGGIVRLHNPQSSDTPLVLLSAWPSPVIRTIAARLPQHPLYVLRVAHDFANPANHQYLVFCYLEWLESVLAPLQRRPYILAGNCRAALLALELAQLLQPRQLQPLLTVLLQWDPRLAGPTLPPYSGPVAYQIHRDHHSGDPRQAQQLLDQLRQLTPAAHQVVFSATTYNAESAYPAGQQPYESLIRLVDELSSAISPAAATSGQPS